MDFRHLIPGSQAIKIKDESHDVESSMRFDDFEESYVNVSTADIPCVDPLAVNKLLSRELNQLSLDRREDILEEIHGVKPGEDAALQCSNNNQITQQSKEENALREFQEELDRLYFSECAPMETNPFALGNRNSRSGTYSAYRYARQNGSELIQDRDFRLTFFGREEGSCPKEAAKRMLNYLEFVRQVYNTDDVLFRPITLSDLNEALGSKSFMHDIAPFQLLPLRDPSGRRVFVHLRDCGPTSCPIIVRQQVGMYLTQCLSEECGGTVFVSFLHHINHNIYSAQEYRDLQRMIETIPPKFSAVHICFPKGTMYEIAKAAIILLIGKENRQRLRLHVGSYQECKYALRSFGIPVDRLPVDLQSKPKHSTKTKQYDLRYHRKWLSMRAAKETAMFAAIGRDSRGRFVGTYCDEENSKSFKGVMAAAREIRSKFVECPRHEDCLFGKGRPAMYHPGNIAMRRLLDTRIKRFEAMVPLQKSIVVWEVVNEIKRGTGRFLKEDTDHAGLFVITDDETAFKKIAIAFRDLKKRRLRYGDRKEVCGKPVTQQKEKKDPQSTKICGKKRPAPSSKADSSGIPSGQLSSASLSVGVNFNVGIDIDGVKVDDDLNCFFPLTECEKHVL